MSITIKMFQTAMETYGAERSSGRIIAGNGLPVPGFIVSGITFVHSGTDYIVTIGKEVPEEILERAMAEFGETSPGNENFWWGGIHSLKGILTLSAMLDGKYSKGLVDELTNATYKNLLSCSSIPNVGFPFHGTPGMESLYKVLTEYSNTVNPFGNTDLNLKDLDFKEPTQYLDDVQVSLASQKGRNPYKRLILSTNSSKATFAEDEKGWFYDTYVSQGNGYIGMGHYYFNGISRPVDEVVRLHYKVNKDNYDPHPDDIDLRISLKTALSWSFHEKQAEPATNEQIEIMITHLKISIEEIRKDILCKMTT